ncbi:hypothetical protein [Methanolobus psychrotolerans]|uniref:hypothetical protein n=1 Tax=Methanolobus psychrotolerans TaxID=1874706 RepID=UPI000B915754|nr:hypothetical protein [Methanolobus psychrotolerans]
MVTRYINKVGVFSLGKIAGVLYAILGLIFGLFMALFSMPMSFMSVGSRPGGLLFGAAAIILFPIFYGVIGFISGVITALVFNASTGIIGGLEIEMKEQ